VYLREKAAPLLVVEATLASALLPSSHDEALERDRCEATLPLSETSPAEEAVGGLPNLKASVGASRSSSSFFLMAARTS
jgi:hypothetical protein